MGGVSCAGGLRCWWWLRIDEGVVGTGPAVVSASDDPHEYVTSRTRLAGEVSLVHAWHEQLAPVTTTAVEVSRIHALGEAGAAVAPAWANGIAERGRSRRADAPLRGPVSGAGRKRGEYGCVRSRNSPRSRTAEARTARTPRAPAPWRHRSRRPERREQGPRGRDERRGADPAPPHRCRTRACRTTPTTGSTRAPARRPRDERDSTRPHAPATSATARARTPRDERDTTRPHTPTPTATPPPAATLRGPCTSA